MSGYEILLDLKSGKFFIKDQCFDFGYSNVKKRLIYFETFSDVYSAIAREKTIKGWIRKKKIELINSTNPNWNDLSCNWYD